ncbi:MAG: DUF2202 domain-containing protein [Bacteroidetes bacterium]|nr:DUF2202 domain-containing protein [Bacteroidota bacterium]
MYKLFFNIVISLSILGLSAHLSACSSDSETASLTASVSELAKVDIASADLTDEVANGIIFMREEEKLARDVYSYFYEKYQARIFTNISRSETRHMSSVKTLLERYELEDPITEDVSGQFVNAELQELYNTLVEQGNESLAAALEVGAIIEEVDILDLLSNLGLVDAANPDIVSVYANLGKGSESHLKAFVRNLSAQGITYTPHYLTEEQYIAIIGE